ncbi:MAG: hypothetical protein PHE88_05340 [Elusimicrobia bacterium]|nr:hypothetical protein [Elusimicrobiota bacterium]
MNKLKLTFLFALIILLLNYKLKSVETISQEKIIVGKTIEASDTILKDLLKVISPELVKSSANSKSEIGTRPSAIVVQTDNDVQPEYIVQPDIIQPATRDMDAYSLLYLIRKNRNGEFALDKNFSFKVKPYNIFSWEVLDLNKDNISEVFISCDGGGTGVDAAACYIIDIKDNAFLTYDFTWLKDPGTFPTWEFTPSKNLDKARENIFISYFKNKYPDRFLTADMVKNNLDNNKYAEQVWVIDNKGYITNGKVKIRKYKGNVVNPSSRLDVLKIGKINYYAIFKGGTWAYDEENNETYIIYIAKDMYNWPTTLVSDNKYLWIGTRGDGIIRYNVKEQVLKHYPEFNNVEKLKIKNDKMLIKGEDVKLKEYEIEKDLGYFKK